MSCECDSARRLSPRTLTHNVDRAIDDDDDDDDDGGGGARERERERERFAPLASM